MSSRRLVPIKRGHGEPLTRADLQYDLLRLIFSDTHSVFTDPWPNSLPSVAPKLTFREVYIKALLNSTKTTKTFRDKLAESDAFAEDFAMIALLVNVGRINTTMSFFPEMKTTIRSYHPVPALQRTSGNLQDAPRIKHILKSVPYESETNGPSHLPADILSRLSSGHVPPTTVTNLIFVLANHSSTIGQLYLPDNIDFIDLFMRTDLSSASRANAFLWLCFNYLEGPSMESENDNDSSVIANPFGGPGKDGKLLFVHLAAEEIASENVDPPDELKRAEKLVEHRGILLQGLQSKDKDKTTPSASDTVADDHNDALGLGGEEIPLIPKGKRKRENPPTTKISRNATKDQKSAGDKMAKSRKPKGKAVGNITEHSQDSGSSSRATRQRVINMRNQYPSHEPVLPTPSDALDSETNNRFAPYPRELTSLGRSSDVYQAARARHPAPPRSFLQHAWLKVTTVDPLVDSDDEGDEFIRHEYMQRLRVIAGIRGTPFSDSAQLGQLPLLEFSHRPQSL